MFWFWLTLSAVVGAVAGAVVGFNVADSMGKEKYKDAMRYMAGIRSSLFFVLRRELANWMIRRDPDRYVDVYKDLKDQVPDWMAATGAARSERMAALREKYPSHEELDHVGTREYVLYEGIDSTFDEVEEHYRALVEFHALVVSFDKDKGWDDFSRKLPYDAAYTHLQSYAQRWKDSRLEARVHQVMTEYRAYQRGQNRAGGKFNYEDYEAGTFSVRSVSHFAEIRYGIHFKDTNEFALHSTFIGDDLDDDPEPQIYISIYRTNAAYENEALLDTLNLNP